MVCRSKYCRFEWGHIDFLLKQLAEEGEFPRFLLVGPQTRAHLTRELMPEPYLAQPKPYHMTHIINKCDGSLIEVVESGGLALDTGVLQGDGMTFLVFQRAT